MPGNKPMKHPVTSRKQQAMFAAELGRRKKGMAPQTLHGMTSAEIERHLSASKGKRLPRYAGQK